MNSASTAAQVLVTVIPIVGIVTGGMVIIMFIYYNYKQKVLLIEKSADSVMSKKKNFDLDTFSLFSGLILLAIGLSLMIFFLIKEGMSYSVLSGLIPLSVGLSLLVFFILRIKIYKKND